MSILVWLSYRINHIFHSVTNSTILFFFEVSYILFPPQFYIFVYLSALSPVAKWDGPPLLCWTFWNYLSNEDFKFSSVHHKCYITSYPYYIDMIYHDISVITIITVISLWRKMLDDQLCKSNGGKSPISMERRKVFDFSTCNEILRMQILKNNSCSWWNFVKIWSTEIIEKHRNKDNKRNDHIGYLPPRNAVCRCRTMNCRTWNRISLYLQQINYIPCRYPQKEISFECLRSVKNMQQMPKMQLEKFVWVWVCSVVR